VVPAVWLADHLEDPEVVVAAVRWMPGAPPGAVQDAFEQGHLPGAISFDVDTDLAALPGDGLGRHPLPSPEAFAVTMAAAGIGDDAFVVTYDDVSGSHAARLWWMLDTTGHRAAILDGGIQAWTGRLETGPAIRRSPASFTARAWPSVGPDDVIASLREGAVVLDARAPGRYRGEVEPFDPVAGHVPSARSAPWTSNVDEATGRFLSAEELRARFASLGVLDGSTAIAYCGSGITAAHDLAAMRRAGLGMGRLFAGSWSGWVEDRSRPVATGGEPGPPP